MGARGICTANFVCPTGDFQHPSILYFPFLLQTTFHPALYTETGASPSCHAGQRQGHTLDKLPAPHRATDRQTDTLGHSNTPEDNLESPVNWKTCRQTDGGGKGNQTGRTCTQLHPPRQDALGAGPWTMGSALEQKFLHCQRRKPTDSLTTLCSFLYFSSDFSGSTAALHERALKPDAEVHARTHERTHRHLQAWQASRRLAPAGGRKFNSGRQRRRRRIRNTLQLHSRRVKRLNSKPPRPAPRELPATPSVDGEPTFHSAHGGEHAQQEHRSPSGRRGRVASPLVVPHYPADNKDKSSQRNAVLFH